MEITPNTEIEIRKWGALGIIEIIYGVVYICTCKSRSSDKR